MKYSVSSYSFQQKISAGAMTQLDTVRAAAEMGFDAIEFTELKPVKAPSLEEQLAYADRIRETAEQHKIEIVAYLVGANLYRGSAEEDDKELARLRGQVEVAHRLGARILRHDVCYSERIGERVIGFEAMLPTMARHAREITEYAASLGIRTCSENHGFVAQDSDRMERMYYAVGHSNYGLLVDVGNFACVDEASVSAVSRLAPLAIHVHAKDFHCYPFGTPKREDANPLVTRGCNHLYGCTIGEGDIPVAQCLAILKRAGYDGYVTVEYEGSEDCMLGIPRGLERLRSYE
ncbi:MAG: sugar phosphate isomerase/epimerase [Clostridia bacterium]|nr:sugar phosphate isomerase/epimerase [Clostridia bacterium]